jgi:bifunctional UDP-N-acetylglucosamine pyrophosphorylase/glucosamine-1-phosphate N-acetyltransferase
MQAVFLAAGESTRTVPLTLTRPKTLLTAANKTIIEHNLEQLEKLSEIEEVIIIIGYKGDMIKEKLGDKFGRLPLKYVEQKERKGPGHALMQVRDLLKGKFLVLNGDDFYSAKDINKCLQFDYCVMGQEVEKTDSFGVLEIKDGKVVSFEEKPAQPKSNISNTGLYVFSEKIFEFNLEESPRGELEITDFITFLVKSGETVNCHQVEDYWFPIGYCWDLLKVNEFFVRNLKEDKIEGEIEENVTVKGKIVLGKGSKILSGTYIDGNAIIGENSVVGPNLVIRGHRGGVTIGNNCKISNTDMINSIIMDKVKAKHFNYIGDSVIGENCNFGASTIIANLRHDKGNIKSEVKGEKIDTGLRKFGVVLGDNCNTGIQTSFYPGRKMWPGTSTLPGEIVKLDKKE